MEDINSVKSEGKELCNKIIDIAKKYKDTLILAQENSILREKIKLLQEKLLEENLLKENLLKEKLLKEKLSS